MFWDLGGTTNLVSYSNITKLCGECSILKEAIFDS